MRANDILKAIMREKKMSMAALGRLIGTEGVAQNAATDMISKRLKQKTIGIDRVAEMADKMDYQVLIVPKDVAMKADWYRVGDEENE